MLMFMTQTHAHTFVAHTHTHVNDHEQCAHTHTPSRAYAHARNGKAADDAEKPKTNIIPHLRRGTNAVGSSHRSVDRASL